MIIAPITLTVAVTEQHAPRLQCMVAITIAGQVRATATPDIGLQHAQENTHPIVVTERIITEYATDPLVLVALELQPAQALVILFALVKQVARLQAELI